MLKKSLFLWIALLLAGCASQPTAIVERDDAAVYLAALKYEFKLESVAGLIVKESTASHISAESGEYIQKSFKDLPDTEALEDFIQANQNPKPLDRSFAQRLGVNLLSEEEVSQLFRSGSLADGWKAFYEKYPNALGIVSVSNIGYNRAGNQAFVMVGRTSGPLNGYGEYLYLEKVKGAWQVKKSLMAWIS